MRKPKPCACGCGGKAWGEYMKGHRPPAEVPAQAEVPAEEAVKRRDTSAEGSRELSGETQGPPCSGPVDRRLWRLAAERPNTPKTGPWTETKCHNCLGRMFTRDPLSTWEKGGICEECFYLLTSDFYDRRGQQGTVQNRTAVNPFR